MLSTPESSVYHETVAIATAECELILLDARVCAAVAPLITPAATVTRGWWPIAKYSKYNIRFRDSCCTLHLVYDNTNAYGDAHHVTAVSIITTCVNVCGGAYGLCAWLMKGRDGQMHLYIFFRVLAAAAAIGTALGGGGGERCATSCGGGDDRGLRSRSLQHVALEQKPLGLLDSRYITRAQRVSICSCSRCSRDVTYIYIYI